MKYKLMRERTDIITYTFVDYVDCNDPEESDESESVILSEQIITGDTITLSVEHVTIEK